MKIKTIKETIIALSLTLNGNAQSNPQGNPPANNVNAQANAAWYRGGNFPIGTNPTGANIFGTKWNSPIYTQTDGITRTRLNGTLTTNINSVNQNVDGYFGIGRNNFFATNSPYSMLHLEGNNNSPFLSGQWRRWMNTGVYMRENADAMYVGLKQEAGTNRSDAVINWSDDKDFAGGGGPDALRFIFTATADGNGGGITNSLDGSGLNGYEFARMVPFAGIYNSAGFPVGHVGIGPLFTSTQLPQNRLHMNAEDNLANFLQISNQNGTGATAADGLQIGYPTTATTYLTAHVNQKENDNMLMLTNNGERIRVSHIGNVSIANMNPGGLPNNRTRVSISADPASPVTRPLSLLHLGYNTGGILNPNNTDGWRPWMDVGMFVAQSSDNVYLGLKNESTTPLGDQFDAVLSWGDNQINSGLPPNNGPDNFRFIFTSSTTGSAGGTTPATGTDGLEGIRLTPTTANGVYTGIGGAPTANPYSTGLNPGNTAEINSWGATTNPGGSSGLRFTNLNTTSPTLANPGTGVLSVDANGDVIYVPGNVGSGLGNYCSATTQNPLLDDYEIPLNQYNYYFSGNSATKERVAVGVPCGSGLSSKFNVLLDKTINTSFAVGNNAGYFQNINSGNGFNVGVKGEITAAPGDNAAGYFRSISSAGNAGNHGVYAVASNAGAANTGGRFQANGGLDAIGVFGTASGGTNTNYAGYFNGDVYIAGTFGPSDLNLKENIDTITNALAIVKLLKPKSFDFKQSSYPSMNLPNGKQYGLIAQEVELLLPELVNNNTQPAELDSNGTVVTPSFNFKGLEYQQLIPFLIKAIQEQQSTIDSLRTKLSKQDSINNAVQQQLSALSSLISNCCSNNTTRTSNNTAPTTLNQLDVELSDKDAIVLNQNVPNPFAEQTTITYNVPESVGKAQIIFFNNLGQVIQTVDIKTRGKGKVNVFASDLSSGLYNYSLIADGKVIDNKKMVRE